MFYEAFPGANKYLIIPCVLDHSLDTTCVKAMTSMVPKNTVGKVLPLRMQVRTNVMFSLTVATKGANSIHPFVPISNKDYSNMPQPDGPRQMVFLPGKRLMAAVTFSFSFPSKANHNSFYIWQNSTSKWQTLAILISIWIIFGFTSLSPKSPTNW